MATIYVRDVPAGTHDELRRQAAAEGLSLQRYLLRMLKARAERPPVAEILRTARDGVRGAADLGLDEIVGAVRAGRDDRT